MQKGMSLALACALVASTAGCYHATVDTGRAPSGQTVEKQWAHGFVYGLVPPSTVETAAKCPNGVAKVETQLSFLNQLASFLTAGIYTPMQISVQCAAGGAALAEDAARVIALPANADRRDLDGALGAAVEIARVEDAPVYVHFAPAE